MPDDGPVPLAATLHAGCVLVGETGILIRGRSGSGKSSLALEILAAAGAAGRFARLVADDRVRVAIRAGRLVARPVAAIAGLIEVRGTGLLREPHEEAALVRLVVDCYGPEDEVSPRWPEDAERVARVCGVALFRMVSTPGRAAASARLIVRQDGGIHDTLVTRR